MNIFLCSSTGDIMKRHEYLYEKVAQWLKEQGYRIADENLKYKFFEPDLVAMKSSRKLIIEAKVANAYRSGIFPALIGDAILRVSNEPGEKEMLLAFLIKQINKKALIDLEDYSRNFLPGLNWFLLDESGKGKACFEGKLEDISFESLPKSSNSIGQGAPQPMLFSPNNQWLLKMLLLPGISSRYWGGPKQKPESIIELSRASKVPQPSVSAFVRKFEKANYIRRNKGQLVVIRYRELLDEWFYAIKNLIRPEFAVCSMYGDSPKEIFNKFKKQSRPPEIIIGQHQACELLGVARSSVKVALLRVYLPVQDFLEKYQLIEDPSSSPAIWILNSNDRPAQQGYVVIDNLPVSDILQCYLDARNSHGRGQEQADYILENILIPHFERK